MMKKKLVLGALCVSIILATGIGASAEVSENHSQWAEESLVSADEAGLLPNFFADRDLTANISRIDFCHLAYKMLEQKSLISENNVKSSFADTDDAEVAFLANSGIINGRSETEFAPNDDITREEAAVILTNTAEFMGVKEDIALFDTVFSDYDTVSDWAKESVRKMDSLGIMRGVGDNNFSPKSNYTMEQSAITMLKLFNLDVSDYESNVYEVKINGDLSLFSGEDKQWIKNDGKTIFTYDGPEEDVADDERSFVFFEKSGKWYFYIHNNKSENYSKNNKCTGIYNAETGNKDYKLMVDTLNNKQGRTDHIDFADDYYMVTTYGYAGAEPVSYITNMELYSYEGEKLASSYYSSYLGGDFLDKDEYPCNNRQIRVDFEKAESPSDKYFVPGEILLDKYPYKYGGYGNDIERILYSKTNAVKGYTPVKLSLPDSEGNNYAVFNEKGDIIYKSDKELFTLIYDDSICIGENHDNSVQIYNPKTKEFIGSIEWDTNEYDTVYKYMYEYLQKNIESDCVSPKGNYRVKGYNTLYSYPYTKYDFWKSEEFNGYTPVYLYLGPNECKYYLYNPDGEVIAESDRKIYLISYDGKPCYTITKQEWVETESGGHDQFYIDVYDLKTGELVEVPEHIKDVTNYMK